MGELRKIWSELPREDLIKELDRNHIWLNAFSSINPSPDFCESLGRQVIDMLKASDVKDGLGVSQTLLLRVNRS